MGKIGNELLPRRLERPKQMFNVCIDGFCMMFQWPTKKSLVTRQKVLRPGLVKGPWTTEAQTSRAVCFVSCDVLFCVIQEDLLVIELVSRHHMLCLWSGTYMQVQVWTEKVVVNRIAS